MTIEPGSPTWRALEQHLARRIAELHRDNEAPTLDQVGTAYLRGVIAGLREVMNLPSSDIEDARNLEDPYEGASL